MMRDLTPTPASKHRKACPVLCLDSTGEMILLLRAQLCQHPESEFGRPNPTAYLSHGIMDLGRDVLIPALPINLEGRRNV